MEQYPIKGQVPSDQSDLLILQERQNSIIDNISQKLAELERKVEVLRVVKGILEGTGDQQTDTNVVCRNRIVNLPVKPFLQLVLLIFLIPLIILLMGYLFFTLFPKVTSVSGLEYSGTALEKDYSALEKSGSPTTVASRRNATEESALDNLLPNSSWHLESKDNLPVISINSRNNFDELSVSDSPPFLASVEKLIIINRNVWGGKDPVREIKPLNHPVPLVIVIHTVTAMCSTFNACSSTVRLIQDYHISAGHPDIGYNFLIGNDGNVYAGLGWDSVNYTRDKSISIAFIGNFIYDQLTPGMIHMAKSLLEEGVKLNKISPDYDLVCHNQTKNTLSPGPNVYKVVKTWPHYKSGRMM